MSAIFSILSAIISSSIVRQILSVLVTVLVNQASDMLPKVLDKSKEVMGLPLTNEEKFQAVYASIKEQYPEAKENVIKSLIELSVMKLNAGAGK
jgi:hypothetical protein